MDNFNYLGMPMTLGMGIAYNERMIHSNKNLTEAQKEDIIMRCRDAKSHEEADKIVHSMSNYDNYSQLFQEP